MNAVQDFAVTYSLRGWVFGWLGRIVWQIVFYTLIGGLLGSAERQRYLLVGASVMAVVTEVMLACASSTWERRAGTLPLLVAAPGSLLPVFAGRSVQWPISSVATSSIALVGVGAVFGISWTVGSAIGAVALLVVCAASTYCMALALAAIVLRMMELRNVISSVAVGVTTAISGAVVPVGYWPTGVQAVAYTLPVTHGLSGVRAVIAGGPYGEAVTSGLLALAVGAGWFVLADLLLRQFVENGRRTGTLELGGS